MFAVDVAWNWSVTLSLVASDAIAPTVLVPCAVPLPEASNVVVKLDAMGMEIATTVFAAAVGSTDT